MKTITLLFIIPLFINSVFGDEAKSVSVMEGDSVTLQTDVPDIQTDNDLTLTWTFGAQQTSIAHINREAKTAYTHPDVLDGRFRDRLHLNEQTGYLTITNINTEDSGLYQVDITVGNKPIKRSFNVNSVSNPESDQLRSVSVKDGDSVTLHTDGPDIKKYDEILWRFKGNPIAKFNKTASDLLEDKIFRDKLQPDVQTGSLQIKNIRTDLSGLYEVDLTTTSSGYTIHQSFTVTVNGEVKSVSVKKGDPVTINTDVPDIKTYDRILWIFGCDDRIAEVNKQNKQFTPDTRFRDRLKLNDQTGDLTITEIRTEDAGDYELKMSSRRRTIQRRFSVIISGLSPADRAGIAGGICSGILITILLLIAPFAGVVIYYHRKDKSLPVDEGKSVDLTTEVNDTHRVEKMEWRFILGEPTSQIWQMCIAAMKRVLGLFSLNETIIAEINPANNIFSTYDGDDDLFRNKLKLNPQTGDLNIKNIRQKHTGVYILKITRGGKTTEKRFNVYVRVTGERKTLEVDEGKSVDLQTEISDMKKVDLIEWRFDETLIAEINRASDIFSTYDGDDDLFRNKLKLNHQTGDLTINNIRWKHIGFYTLKIIRDGKTSYRRFNVLVKYAIEERQVFEGKSVNLETEVKDIQRVDLIEWRFGNKETIIAEINPSCNIFRTSNDVLFIDKLKLNDQTGDLIISDIRWKHYGFYKLKIIKDGEISEMRFMLFVTRNKEELDVDDGESVDLETKVTDIQRVDVIEWRFGNKETLIAEIIPANNIFSTYNGDDDEFRGKLKLNHKTGDLNINHIRQKHTGEYILKIIRDKENSYKRFNVRADAGKVKLVSVNEKESVPLKTEAVRGGGPGETEMQPFLPNNRGLPPV